MDILPKISRLKNSSVVEGETEKSLPSTVTLTPPWQRPMQKEPLKFTWSFRPFRAMFRSKIWITSLEPFRWQELPIHTTTSTPNSPPFH